jgi:hypothetical protein
MMTSLLGVFDARFEPLVWFALGLLGAIGVVAVLQPRRVIALAMREHGWVESAGDASGGRQPSGRSSHVLTLGRLFGVAVLAAVVAIAYFVAQS